MRRLKTLLKPFRTGYAYLRIWLGNGQGFLNDFRYPLLLAIALKVYLPNASYVVMGLIVLAIVIILTIIGWIDLKYIHIAQTQAEINTGKYNPYFTKLRHKFK